MPKSDGPFWTFFNSLPVGAVLFDPDDEGFVEFNDAACAQLGYDREHFARLRVGDIDTERSGAEIQQARARLRLGDRPGRFHTRQRAANGELREVDVTLQVIELNGRRLGYAVWHDVTERERALAILASHARRLEEADRRKDEFLALLAHELRNPLAPILATSEWLRRQPQAAPQDIASAHQTIERQARHLQVLVDELLDVARITTGRIVINRSVVPVRDIVLAAAEQARVPIEEHRHRLRIMLPPDDAAGGLRVEGDSARLIQVLSNLLNNAARYTDRGGEIRLEVMPGRDEIAIAVVDNGIGIDADALPRVFEGVGPATPLAGREAENGRSGLGVGLLLAHRLVTLHGGRMAVESEGPGKGSCFTVHLPRHHAQDAARAPAAANAAEPARAASPVASRRILVVDDNVDAAESMALLLRLDGHEVEVLHDGATLVEAARAFRPDVILLDIGLPGRDGFELAVDLRAAGDLSPFTLVAVTGYGQEEDRRKSREAGFDAHLTKPVDFAEVARLVAR